MRRGANYELPFKRRLKEKTNYKKRLRLLVSKKPRLVVRRSLKHLKSQIIEFTPKGDKVLASAHTQELKKYGWDYSTSNIPSGYLIGLLIGKRSLKKNIKNVVIDIGLYTNVKGMKLNAILKGCLDAGLNISHSPEILPSEERIVGKHIIDYFKKIEDNDKKGAQFSKSKPQKIKEMFEKVKSNIEKGK
jgi:large subunit ribosomal protein L18